MAPQGPQFHFYTGKQNSGVFALLDLPLIPGCSAHPGGMLRIAEAWRILSRWIGLEQSVNIWYLGKNQLLSPPAQL